MPQQPTPKNIGPLVSRLAEPGTPPLPSPLIDPITVGTTEQSVARLLALAEGPAVRLACIEPEEINNLFHWKRAAVRLQETAEASAREAQRVQKLAGELTAVVRRLAQMRQG